jgi:hypothetical protein
VRFGALTLPAMRLPASDDTVILDRPGANITVTLASGTQTIRKLYVREALDITGGSLVVGYVPTADSTPISAQFSAPVSLGSGAATTPGPAPAAPRSDERLRRILADIPVTIGRSGLILLVTGSPGTASVIAQAIDESSLTEQEGTLAGDNTLLVLFADEPRLLAWRDRFDVISSSAREARVP